MWYVIQTLTGKEIDVSACINLYVDHKLFNRCFVPLYEDVWRRGGVGHIDVKRMFPSYVMIDTDSPVELYTELKKFPRLTIILYSQKGEDEKVLMPLLAEEEEFFDEILKDGMMRVSYVHVDNKGRLDRVIGPLNKYTEHILKVDVPHRRALAEIPMLGEKKTVKFGLWTDKDRDIPWIEEAKKDPDLYRVEPGKASKITNPDVPADKKSGVNVVQAEYKPGDKVICIRGIYGDTPLEVIKVRPRKGSVVLGIPMFGSITKVEMCMEDVRPVEKG